MRLPVLAFIFLILSLALKAQNPGAAQITTVEGITQYRLDNGLDVLLFPDRSKVTVTVNIVYKVGSRHEGTGEGGMAHLLEHMLFQGTQIRETLIPEMRAHGARFNGTTWFDRTNYYETLPAGDGNLQWALEMEADRMVNSRISAADLESEMSVVRNEFEAAENNPMRVLEDRVRASAYLWHGYGQSTIGTRSDIENVSTERLQAFYHKYYQPDNAVLVIAGSFDPELALTWIEESFGAIPRPERVLEQDYTVEPVQDGERSVNLRRVGDIQGLMMAYHIPATPHEDTAALMVLGSILGDNPSGRLYRALVDGGLAVSSSANPVPGHDPSLLMIVSILRTEQSLEQAEQAALEVIDGLIAEPPSTEEVERAKAGLLRSMELAFSDTTNLALNLSQSIAVGDWRLLFTGRDEIAGVTPEDVARVAAQYLKSSNRTIGRFIPEEAPDRSVIPATPDLVSKLEGYTGRRDIQEGEDFDPTPENIEARVIRVTLPNGLKLSMLAKQNRGGIVSGVLALHLGNQEALFGKDTIGRMAASLLMRGTGEHNRQQIQDELDRLQAQVAVGGSAQEVTANIRTTRANLIATLRLLAEIVKTPSYPESELEQMRQLQLAALDNSMSEPASVGQRALLRHINPYPAGDIRGLPTVEEQRAMLESVTVEQLRQFHRDFYGASNAELSLVGDFDPAEIQPVIEELFASWNSSGDYAQVQRVAQQVEPMDEIFETPDKTNAFTLAVMTFPVSDDHEDYVALTLANRLLGGGPDSRMFQRIREEEGLSYGAQTGLTIGTGEDYTQFIFQAISNPENAARVKQVFLEEMNRAYTEGFTDEEVARAANQFQRDNQVQRSQDAFLAQTLAQYDRYGRTMQRLRDTLDEAAAMTADRVNAAFKKWIDPARLSIAQAGDFASISR